MDWKRLVQFALQGSSDLEQYAILLVRVSIGLFFAISGANKLFFDYRTNVDAYPKWQAWMREKQPRLLVIRGPRMSSRSTRANRNAIAKMCRMLKFTSSTAVISH